MRPSLLSVFKATDRAVKASRAGRHDWARRWARLSMALKSQWEAGHA